MSNYRKGARVERLAIERLSAHGYSCLRSAGSKGQFDIVAYNEGVVRFIQIKSGKASYVQESNRLLDAKLPNCCTAELWVRRDGAWKYIFTTDNREGIYFPEGADIKCLT